MVQVNNSFTNQCYFPYSAGVLQAYAQKKLVNPERYEFLPIIFKRIAIDEAVSVLSDAHIIVLSCYIWNANYTLALAKEIKTQFPDKLIIAGGPHIPGNDIESFLNNNRYVDLVCHNEGEEPFLSILENYQNRAWEKVPSISYLDASGLLQRNEECRRIDDFSNHPSPYLTGVFESLITENPDIEWIGLWETNRGCPFSCAYCDWGSQTKNNVIPRPMSHILQEVDWFSEHKIEFIFCCDANFTILAQDKRIVEKVYENKEKTGYPKALSVQSTKNFTPNSFEAYEIMENGGLSKGVSLSLQSINPSTLDAIKRKNIPSSIFQEAQTRLTQLGIVTFTDIILPLPEETYDSFTSGVSKIIERGQHNRIQFNNLSILPNSLMGDITYQKKYDLSIVESDIINIHGKAADDNEIKERQKLVVGTSSMPTADWIRARVFGWIVALLHFNKLLQIPIIVLHEVYSIGYLEMFNLFMDSKGLKGLLRSVYQFFEQKAVDIASGQSEFCHSEEWLDIWWPADELAVIKICSENKLDQFYDESEKLLAKTISEKKSEGRQLLRTSVRLNRHLIKLPGQQKESFACNWNVYEIYNGALNKEGVEKQSGHYEYRLLNDRKIWRDWQQWCREVIWWGNKRGDYLHKCIRIDQGANESA